MTVTADEAAAVIRDLHDEQLLKDALSLIHDVAIDTVGALDVTENGAKGDVVSVLDAAIAVDSNRLSSTSAAFTPADVNKYVQVIGAGQPYPQRGAWAPTTAYSVGDQVTNGGHTYTCSANHTSPSAFTTTNWADMPASSETLMSRITGVDVNGTATLADNAGTTVAGTKCTHGTDDSAAVNALIGFGNKRLFFPTGTYFLTEVYAQSHVTFEWGDGCVIKIPYYPNVGPASLKWRTSNSADTTSIVDVHSVGWPTFDHSELSPSAAVAQPVGIQVRNCQHFSIEGAYGVGMVGYAGNVVSVAPNQGYDPTNPATILSNPAHGEVGPLTLTGARGRGVSCVQITGGSDIRFGRCTADGGVPARVELDNNYGIIDNVTFDGVHATGTTVYPNSACYAVPHGDIHPNSIKRLRFNDVLAEGGNHGLTISYSNAATIFDVVVDGMTVRGGGSVIKTLGNDQSFPGLVVKNFRGTGATGFGTECAGYTMVDGTIESGASYGAWDIFRVGGYLSTPINRFERVRFLKNTTYGGQFLYSDAHFIDCELNDDPTLLTPTTAQLLASNEYTGTLAGWSAATSGGASAPSGSSGTLTITADGTHSFATVRTALHEYTVTPGQVVRFRFTLAPGTGPANGGAFAQLWTYDSSNNFVSTITSVVSYMSGSTIASLTYLIPTGVGKITPLMVATNDFAHANTNLTNGNTFLASNISLALMPGLTTQNYGLDLGTGVTAKFDMTDAASNAVGPVTGTGTLLTATYA